VLGQEQKQAANVLMSKQSAPQQQQGTGQQSGAAQTQTPGQSFELEVVQC
jgi:hypothetical protein